MAEPLLKVENLEVHFPVRKGFLFQKTAGCIKAVDGISFEVSKGETLGLVGESGCGKSTTAKAILQLERPTGGSIYFEGKDLNTLHGNNLREIYRNLQIIYQDPYASLNPRMTIGNIIAEPLVCFNLYPGEERWKRVEYLLETVGMDPRFIYRYPHEFSGGQRQRIGIARALAVDPALIICDEPVSALDVSIRAQVINLLEDLQANFGFSYIFIAHDLSVVKHISDRVAVMYLGRIVEIAPSEEIYNNPLHPYTTALLSAVPIPDPVIESQRKRIILPGDVSVDESAPQSCNFAPRCGKKTKECMAEQPQLKELRPGHRTACFNAE